MPATFKIVYVSTNRALILTADLGLLAGLTVSAS